MREAEQAGAGVSSSEQSRALQLQDAPRQAASADAPQAAAENRAYTSGAWEEVEGGRSKQPTALQLQDTATEGALSGSPTSTMEDKNLMSIDRQGHQQETCEICCNAMQHICVSHPAD